MALGNGATYTYTCIAAPVAFSVRPRCGTTAGGTPVVITGTGFSGVISVLFGKLSAIICNVTDTELDVITSPHLEGAVPITITTRGGTDSALQLSYQACPVIVSITPASGPVTAGNTVVITGTNSTDVNRVFFESIPATAFTIISDTELDAVVPVSAVQGVVCVTLTAPCCSSNSVPYQTTSAYLKFGSS